MQNAAALLNMDKEAVYREAGSKLSCRGFLFIYTRQRHAIHASGGNCARAHGLAHIPLPHRREPVGSRASDHKLLAAQRFDEVSHNDLRVWSVAVYCVVAIV